VVDQAEFADCPAGGDGFAAPSFRPFAPQHQTGLEIKKCLPSIFRILPVSFN
jgi:hypothetical protein